MDADKRIALVLTRNDLYRRRYFFALGIFALSMLVIIALLFMLFFVHRHPPSPLYFATDDVTHLVEVVPVTQPNMTMDELQNWVVEAVVATYSYDYVNYRRQLQSAQKYFTAYGWSKYMAALTASNNLLGVERNKYVIDAKVVARPRMIAQAYLQGALAWKFTMPLLVTYSMPPYDDSPNSKFSNPLTVTVIVQRQPILQSYQGLGIVQLIASWGDAGT